MTQEQINKLQELKKLLDAGILTPEEIQVEKAKILGTQQEQPVETTHTEEETLTESAIETEEVAVPLPTDAFGRVIFDMPEAEQQPTSPLANKGNSVNSREDNNISKLKNALIIVLLFLLAVSLIFYGLPTLISKINNNSEINNNLEDRIAPSGQDPINYYSGDDFSSNEAASDDEFAFDPWIGTMTLDGSVYRSCDSRCYLSFKKVSKGEYTGTICVMLGFTWPDHEERFDPSYGYLEGTVRAKSDGNVLTVVMDRYTSRAYNPNSDDTNYFENTNISGQIFRITYNGGSYSAVTVGDMEGYIDGIEVKK